MVKYYAIIFKRKSTKEEKLPALILHQLRERRFRKITLLPGSKIWSRTYGLESTRKSGA